MVGAGRGYGRQSLQASERMLSFLPDLGPAGPQLRAGGGCQVGWLWDDPSSPHLVPRSISLPESGSGVVRLVWSCDGDSLELSVHSISSSCSDVRAHLFLRGVDTQLRSLHGRAPSVGRSGHHLLGLEM